MKVVEVIWLDAHCTTSDTTTKKAARARPLRTYSIGYLVAENEEGITLAMDRYEKDIKSVRVTSFIPHGMIEEWHEYA